MASLVDLETGQEEEDLLDLEEVAASDSPNLLGSAWEGIKGTVTGPVDLVSSFVNAQTEHPYLSSISGVGPLLAGGAEGVEYLGKNPRAIAPTVAGLGSAAIGTFATPLAGAMSYPTLQYGAQRANDYIWPEQAQEPKDQLEQLVRDMYGSVAPAVGGRLGSLAVEKLSHNPVTKWGGEKLDRFSGARQKYIADYNEANQPGSSAAMFNAPKGTVGAENQIPVDLMKYEDTFYDIAPFEGVSPAPGKNASQEILNNLTPAGEKALRAKTALLQELDNVGPGISFEDLDLSSFDRQAQKIGSSAFASPGAMDDVLTDLRASFNKPANYTPRTATGYINPSNVQTILTTVDDEIREIGGWDKKLKAGAVLTPSQAARIDQLPELMKVRESLRGALENYSDAYSNAPGALSRLNQVIATTREYGEVIQRHIPEVIQGMTRDFAPGRSMTSPQTPSSVWNSPVNSMMNSATGGYVKDLARSTDRIENVAQSWETPARLQRFAKLRGQKFAPPNGFITNGLSKMSEGIQTIMERLGDRLYMLQSLNPQTGEVHDPRERTQLASAVQSMTDIDPQAKYQALSDVNSGRLPGGSIAQEQQQPLPDLDMAFGAASSASVFDENGLSAESEDDLLSRQLDFLNETNYRDSGL